MTTEILQIDGVDAVTVTETIVELVEIGIQGPPGASGTGLNLRGALSTVGDLPMGAAQNDAYIVAGDIWAWSGFEWLNLGPAGVPGEPGEPGAQGVQGIQGIQGIQGVQGLQGIQGDPGAPGSTPTWDALTGKPSTFPPSTHSHAISDVTDLQDEIGNRVRYDAAQSLTTGEATQARSNIGAASAATLSTLLTDLGDLTTDLSAVYVTAKT